MRPMKAAATIVVSLFLGRNDGTTIITQDSSSARAASTGVGRLRLSGDTVAGEVRPRKGASGRRTTRNGQHSSHEGRGRMERADSSTFLLTSRFCRAVGVPRGTGEQVLLTATNRYS